MVLDEPLEVSFVHPDATFYLPKWPHTDPTCNDSGHWQGAPTGEVVCAGCFESHENVDEIPHDEDCPQRHVHSRFWKEQHAEDEAPDSVRQRV